METILVTVSVLSTLLVVGIVLAVVIVFNKFKGKVDVEKYKMYHYDNEKEMNGAEVFKGVKGDNSVNHTYLELDSLDYRNNFAF